MNIFHIKILLTVKGQANQKMKIMEKKTNETPLAQIASTSVGFFCFPTFPIFLYLFVS